MTCETKIRLLASADPTLQGIFGVNPFRWFHIQLPPGQIPQRGATCAEVLQVSQVPIYCQEGMNRLNNVRMQITVLDPDVDKVDAAVAAIADWLGTVCFSSDAQFTSPASVPTQQPNFVMNIRPGLRTQLKPVVPTATIDFKVWNIDLI